MTGETGPRQRRLCLVVDIEAYSGKPYPVQQRAQTALARALDHACERAGVGRASCDLQDRGDGQLLLLPTDVDEERAVPGLVLGLRDALFTLNASAAVGEGIRLRVALTQGSVQRAPLGYVAWSVELGCRLLDSASLRRELAKARRSDMALIVSADLYADIFATGTGGIPAAEFRRVRIDIPKKRFTADAWISAPAHGVAVPLGAPEKPSSGRRFGGGRVSRLVGEVLLVGGALVAADVLLGEGPLGGVLMGDAPDDTWAGGDVPVADTVTEPPVHHDAVTHPPVHHDPVTDWPAHDDAGVAHLGPGERPIEEEHHQEHHLPDQGDLPMSYADDTGQTWDDGRLAEDDVIEAADHTGYTSVSDYIAGDDGYEPDPVSGGDHDSAW